MTSALGMSTITPPELRSMLGEAVIKFDLAYERYLRQIAEINRGSTRANNVSPAGYKACVSAELLTSMVMMRTFGNVSDVEGVTDEMVKTWVKGRSRCTVSDIPGQVKTAIGKVKFKINKTDPEGASMQFFADVMTELRRNRVGHVLQESSKTVIQHLIPKLEPRQVRDEIQEALNYWSKENKSDFTFFMKEVGRASAEFAKYAKKSEQSTGKSHDFRKSPSGSAQNFRKSDKPTSGGSIEDSDKTDKDGRRHGNKRTRHSNWTEPCLNPDCDEIHPLYLCTNTSKDLKDKLLSEYRDRKKKRLKSVKSNSKPGDSRYLVRVEEVVEERALGDNGADESAMPLRVLQALENAGVEVDVKTFKNPVQLTQAMKTSGGAPFTSSRKVRISAMRIRLPCGPLRLRNIDFWVTDQDMDEILLGRPLLKCIGFDLDEHLAKVREKVDNMDIAEEMANGFNARNIEGGETKLSCFKGYKGLWYDQGDVDPVAFVPSAGAGIGIDTEEEISAALDLALEKAKDEGMSDDGLSTAKALLTEFRDIFRIQLGPDPPAKLEPLRIQLRDNAKPCRNTQRRYAPKQRIFLEQTVRELEKVGAIYPNPKAKWASPALAVPKPGSDKLRFTVDLRGPNRETIPVASAMPDLPGQLESVRKSTVFSKNDMCHAYWQVPLHPESRECMSIQTPLGVYTPTRILQGSTDAGNHFQSTTSQVFIELWEQLLQWLDDFLFHAATEAELLTLLRRFFQLCQLHNLKLHAGKLEIFLKEAKFCGRVIDSDGMRYEPTGLKTILQMKSPERAGDLQQFLCATNWMRNSIPNYSGTVSPLHHLMEHCYKTAGKRTKRAVKNVSLTKLWGADHTKAFESVKSYIASSMKLAHPKDDWVKCLFSDASDTHWASLLSQVPKNQMKRDVEEQEHEPLAFLSGSFTGHSANWSIVEKEGFAVVESMSKLDHLTAAGEVSVFTDHSNLQYIFDPYGRNPGVSKQVANKLMRWALKLSTYRYVIEYLPGERNVWADMLTRWAVKDSDRVKSIKLSSLMYAPIDMSISEDYDWPTRKEIANAQSDSAESPPAGFSRKQGVLQNTCGVFWVPSEAETLKLRIIIAAHAGVGGHRKKTQTMYQLLEHFYWENMKNEVSTFCDSCIHCLATESGERVPRPMGHSLTASRPNEILHFDFCYIGEASDANYYVLILKDGMSSYVRFYACETTDAETTVHALIDWFCTFSVVRQWISDQGSHFKNELMKLLKERLRSSHHFTLPYCPWSNGTVEVVCRELTRCMRALLSEYSLPFKFWPSILPLVQSVLNNMKLERLGGRSPAKAFMAIDPVTPMTEIKLAVDGKVKLVSVDESRAKQVAHIERVQMSLEDMHKDVSLRSNAAREKRVRAHNRKTGVRRCNFDVGDFVLRGILKTKKKNKLGVSWKGPMRVSRVLSDYLFELEDLRSGAKSTVHGTRIKLFRNSDYGNIEELDEYLAFQEGEYCVAEEIQDIRNAQGSIEVLVKWKGFDDEEPQWESLEVMREDIPKMISDFLQEISLTGTATQQRIARSIM